MGQFGQVLGIFFPIFCLGVEQKVETFGAGCSAVGLARGARCRGVLFMGDVVCTQWFHAYLQPAVSKPN